MKVVLEVNGGNGVQHCECTYRTVHLELIKAVKEKTLDYNLFSYFIDEEIELRIEVASAKIHIVNCRLRLCLQPLIGDKRAQLMKKTYRVEKEFLSNIAYF